MLSHTLLIEYARRSRALAGPFLFALAGASAAFATTRAQAPARGGLSGRLTDTAGAPVHGAVVHLVGTSYGGVTDGGGRYRVEPVAAGSYLVSVRRLGFASDTFSVTIGATVVALPDRVLRSAAAVLAGVVIKESPRLNETREAALARRDQADNLMVVQSGDEIRSLPNANAAEALARMPGISTERDEGEGKFVQIRGTEPRLSNVTINGAHVPGTENSDRIPKLDDVPSDLLGALEVSKTLRADMDADAIGGSVNMVTKLPEGAPRGYVAIQGGQQSQLNARQGQWSAMYGGRFGEQQKIGALLGVTFDRNNRSIEDVEPAWGVDGARSFPVEWDQRDYIYGRTRGGGVGALDYRFDDGSTLALRGLYSAFRNYGTRYRFDAAGGGDDSLSSGPTGFATGATFVRETSHRTPDERMYGVSLQGQSPTVPISLSYGADFAGTSQLKKNYRTNDFEYDGPTGDGVPLRYDASDLNTPRYRFVNPADSVAALNPANYKFTKYSLSDGSATGHDVGAHLDATTRYSLGTTPSTVQFGLKVRHETKSFVSNAASFSGTTPITLDKVISDYSDPSFYNTIASGFLMGPQASQGAIEAWEDANPGLFKNKTSVVKNQLGSYDGAETISSGYAMQSSDFGAMHVNVGLRAEVTNSSYTGHVAATPQGGTTTVTTTPGSQTYVDLFPSVQVKYSLDDRSDIRAAVTRGIARPNYLDLAPHLTGTECASCKNSFGNLSAGNPDLKPQRAWNFDLLGEHYLTAAGLISGGVFYKKISGFIYDRDFVYDGPVTEFDGYLGTRPDNGGNATLLGTEASYTQRLYMLPGYLAGLGFDLNWTHADSRAELLADTASSAATLGHPITRFAPLPRQSENLANVAGTYDLGRLSARVAWQYQGQSIYSYGDGTSTASGDTYLYSHAQLDASMSVSLTREAQLQIQGLDLNNAVFGFFNGTPGFAHDIQREVYGRSFIVGVKFGF
jgi:TonB-dependent receptor